jgi:H+/Cl- antiporter ClcA
MTSARAVGRFTVFRRGRAFLRLAKARLIFWAGAVAVGLIAVLFSRLTEWASHLFHREIYYQPWMTFVITPLAGIILMWLTRRFFAGIEGSGIPQVMVELERTPEDKWSPLVSLRMMIGKVMLGAGAIGSGFSFGSEGPMVQIGASVMASIRRFLPRGSQIHRRHLLVVGAAAGISAAFNTPLAGIIFAIEELNRGIESRMSALIITGIVLAGIVARLLAGNHSYFDQILISGSYSTVVQIVLLSALVTGILGGLFARILEIAASNWNTPLGRLRANRPYLFAGLCGLLLAALGWTSGGFSYGTGIPETVALLEGKEAIPWHFGITKFIATLVSCISGLPGGTFAPALAIGAGIGHDLFLLLGEDAPSGMLLVFCMTGFLAAVTQAPITAFVIVMEMVDGYRLVIGLMFTALMASGISRSIAPPIYIFLAERLLRNKRAAVPPAPTSG